MGPDDDFPESTIHRRNRSIFSGTPTTMLEWLLDTNIISDIIRRPHGPAARLVHQRGGESFTSIIVVAELEFGLRKRPSQRRETEVRALLKTLSIEAWEHPSERHYAVIRTTLENAGTPIGANDLLIGAHALSLDATLITANESEFRRVPGLRVENWTI